MENPIFGRGGPIKTKDWSKILPPHMCKMRGLLGIQNDDNLCLVRAIVLGMKFIEKTNNVIS